jgi:hypothetical protein
LIVLQSRWAAYLIDHCLAQSLTQALAITHIQLKALQVREDVLLADVVLFPQDYPLPDIDIDYSFWTVRNASQQTEAVNNTQQLQPHHNGCLLQNMQKILRKHFHSLLLPVNVFQLDDDLQGQSSLLLWSMFTSMSCFEICEQLWNRVLIRSSAIESACPRRQHSCLHGGDAEWYSLSPWLLSAIDLCQWVLCYSTETLSDGSFQHHHQQPEQQPQHQHFHNVSSGTTSCDTVRDLARLDNRFLEMFSIPRVVVLNVLSLLQTIHVVSLPILHALESMLQICKQRHEEVTVQEAAILLLNTYASFVSGDYRTVESPNLLPHPWSLSTNSSTTHTNTMNTSITINLRVSIRRNLHALLQELFQLPVYYQILTALPSLTHCLSKNLCLETMHPMKSWSSTTMTTVSATSYLAHRLIAHCLPTDAKWLFHSNAAHGFDVLLLRQFSMQFDQDSNPRPSRQSRSAYDEVSREVRQVQHVAEIHSTDTADGVTDDSDALVINLLQGQLCMRSFLTGPPTYNPTN